MSKLITIAFLLLFMLSFAPCSEGAISATGQQCNARTSGSTASVSCTVSVTSGNTVILFGFTDAGVRVGGFDNGGCGDNQGNTYKLVNVVAAQGGTKMCVSALTHTASTTFTFTMQGGNGFGAITVVEFSGLVTATPSLDQTKGKNTTGSNSASATTFATTTADQVVVAGVAVNGSGTMTCDTGYTQIAEDETYTSITYSACYKIVSSTGTQQHTWTSPNTTAASVIATFSQNATGLTGSNIYASGHQCSTNRPSGSRVASTSCVMPVIANSLVVFIAHAEESRIGTTDATGCADDISSSYSYGIMHNSSAGNGVKICYAVPSAADIGVFTWTNQGGTTWTIVDVFEVLGAPTTSITDVTALNDSGAGASSNATTGTTGTTAQANELVLDALMLNGTGTISCGAGYTQIDEDESNVAVSFSDCYKVVSATGTQSMTWTSPSGSWQAAIITFKASSSGNTTFSSLTLAADE